MAKSPLEVMAAVKRKLNITWDSVETDARVADVIQSVTSVLSNRLAYKPNHAFSSDDGEAWPLFLNACLYEFSDAIDDFWINYAVEIRACRALNSLSKPAGD